MKLATALELFGTAAGGQSEGSSKVARKWYVVDKGAQGYGHVVSEHDTEDDAQTAALARPNGKVVSDPRMIDTPEIRDLARQRMVRSNPDID